MSVPDERTPSKRPRRNLGTTHAQPDASVDASPRVAGHVLIFDTTLRDGEQAPGCTMTTTEKVAVAEQLRRLGVDIIEAGFPAASPGERDAVGAVARAVGDGQSGPIICGLARTSAADIDACYTALEPATRKRIHTFIATSDIHMEHKLRLSRGEVIDRVSQMVEYARSLCPDVEFSAEDAARSDPDFLCEVFRAAVSAGATTINVPDTVGYSTPAEYSTLIARVVAELAAAQNVVVSTHCHDDLGLAVANSLAGVTAGARQVECTVNGIGERAGNASLEEVVMALQTRRAFFGTCTRVKTTEIVATSRLVSNVTGIRMPANKAVVGANAFAHEAGIHQDGVLKHRETYEIMTAESIGLDGNALILGKHSGRRAFRERITRLTGVTPTDEHVSRAFKAFKKIADTRKQVTDDDIATIIRESAETSDPEPRTLFDKLWDAHVVVPETPDTPAMLYIDLHMVHEVTSPQAFTTLRERGLQVRRPEHTVATMDHSTSTAPRTSQTRGSISSRDIPVLDVQAAAQLAQLQTNCDEFAIPLHALGDDSQGIVHVIGPELGLTQPGMTIVCGDSHTSTHGAFGALAFGIGTSEVAHVLATQCLLQRKPKTMEVRLTGTMQRGMTAKDVILAVIAKIGIAGATGHVIEYTGDVVHAMSMEERMTVCNMSIEAGARAGMIAPDETTTAYVAGRRFAPTGATWDAGVVAWRALRTDPGARYDSNVTIDVSTLAPMITFGTNPGMAIATDEHIPGPDALHDPSERAALINALAYMDLEPGQQLLGKPIDVVFIGSCTNSRISDLRLAASIFRDRRIAPSVRVLIVPGSQTVKRQAEMEGLDVVFRDAGAEWREAGCSMCIAMNGDELTPGQYAVSTSNRNFEGRQGAGSRTFLASPLTAAASAITGTITDPRSFIS